MPLQDYNVIFENTMVPHNKMSWINSLIEDIPHYIGYPTHHVVWVLRIQTQFHLRKLPMEPLFLSYFNLINLPT